MKVKFGARLCDGKGCEVCTLCTDGAKSFKAMQPIKKKVMKKYVPPDISAVKLLLDIESGKRKGVENALVARVLNCSSAELARLKEELIAEILSEEG